MSSTYSACSTLPPLSKPAGEGSKAESFALRHGTGRSKGDHIANKAGCSSDPCKPPFVVELPIGVTTFREKLKCQMIAPSGLHPALLNSALQPKAPALKQQDGSCLASIATVLTTVSWSYPSQILQATDMVDSTMASVALVSLLKFYFSLQDIKIEIPDQDYSEGPPPRTQSMPPIMDDASAVNPLEDLHETQSLDNGPRYEVC